MSAPVHEHEFEPVPGLPERLPDGERMLWQGSPDWIGVARRVFHLDLLAAYFTALVAWSAVDALRTGGAGALIPAVVVPLTLSVGALGMLAMLAHLTARSAVYSITSRRVVLRVGIVLSVTFNIPFRRIAAADLKPFRDGTGDLALTLARGDHIGYLHLWPHARPWRLARPQPTLRSIPDAPRAASILSAAMLAADPSVALASGSSADATRGASHQALAPAR